MISTVRAELLKAATLRSIQITVLAALLVPPALAFSMGLAAAAGTVSFPLEWHGFETAGFGQPLVILLGALVAGSEFVDTQVRSTLLATPRRGRVLAAKGFVIAVLACTIGTVTSSLVLAVTHPITGMHGPQPGPFAAAIGWNVAGVAINYTLIALLAAAVTVIARSLIVTLVALIPLVLGLSISLVGPLPVLRYLPDLAGLQLMASYPGIGLLEPIPGGLVMAAWTVLLMAIAALMFSQRDVG